MRSLETITCDALRVVDSEGIGSIDMFPNNFIMRFFDGKGLGVHMFTSDNTAFFGLKGRSNGDGRKGEVPMSVGEGGGFMFLSGETGSVNMDLVENGGRVVVEDKDYQNRAMMLVDDAGGHVRVRGKDEKRGASMIVAEADGRVDVYAEGGKEASMKIKEHGGRVDVYGKGSNTTRGSIAVWEKDGEPRTLVGSDKRGGKVIVLGKEGKAKTVVGVNEYGNGSVSTWDKNGNRLK